MRAVTVRFRLCVLSIERRPRHLPSAIPTCKCGADATNHRPEHKAQPTRANPEVCECGAFVKNHRKYKARGKPRKRVKPPLTFWLVDGEGVGRNPHQYRLLAAASEHGQNLYIESDTELRTKDCLNFFLSLPRHIRLFSFSFLYDITLILKDLDNDTLYLLMHEELRAGQRGPKAISWQGYLLNYQRGKFTIGIGKRKVVVWDIWRFFQSSFVKALESWQVCSKEELDRIAHMKEHRGEFDKQEWSAVIGYCISECVNGAKLARKLDSAHRDCGLELKNYYGAGSTAACLLKKMGVNRHEPSDDMMVAIASAFFGGRFENSVIGPVEEEVWSYDISSAYPYQLPTLPCLEHGRWEYIEDRWELEGAEHAIVKYMYWGPDQGMVWAPFPHRLPEGSICFPNRTVGGWVYLSEYLSGEKLFPGVYFLGAWVYRRECDCKSPFATIPDYYRERVKLGKDSKGIVLKLGMNSCYGKLAQSVGRKPPFQNWIWAGMITSNTRAMILDAMGLLPDPAHLLMVATDGIYTTSRISFPAPRDTGTSDLPKPLGGWEEKLVPNGVFAARPGIYFPLNPTAEQMKEVRARGIGKKTLETQWELIQNAYMRGESTVTIPGLVRFCGAKTSLHRSKAGIGRAQNYGQWLERPVVMSFDPLPKRACVNPDKRTLALVNREDASYPYDRVRAALSPDTLMLRAAEIEASEQPDGGDLTEDFPG